MFMDEAGTTDRAGMKKVTKNKLRGVEQGDEGKCKRTCGRVRSIEKGFNGNGSFRAIIVIYFFFSWQTVLRKIRCKNKL